MDHIFSVVRIHAIIITTFLWKIYGPRGIDITSFLGGLVNSTAAVAELSRRVKESGGKLLAVAYRGCNLATAAMLLRNSLLLAILSWPALVSSLVPMVLMVSASHFFAWRSFKINDGLPDSEAPKLSQCSFWGEVNQ